MTLKGQSLWEWKKWLEAELNPPLSPAVIAAPEAKYVLEAFLELVSQVVRNS
jgi:uncharacterized membrane protein YebE (DUF533 family)